MFKVKFNFELFNETPYYGAVSMRKNSHSLTYHPVGRKIPT